MPSAAIPGSPSARLEVRLAVHRVLVDAGQSADLERLAAERERLAAQQALLALALAADEPQQAVTLPD